MVDWDDPSLVGQLRALHARGFSYREIGKELGIGRNAAIGKAHRLGLTARVNLAAEGPRLRARPMAAKGDSVSRETSARCLFGELDDNRCHFPLWGFDPSEPRFYCGAPTEADGPYCEFHARLVSQPDREG